MKMIAMRVVGLMIAFACFDAGLGLSILSDIFDGILAKKAQRMFSTMDADGDGIAELQEITAITDCMAEKLHLEENNKRQLCRELGTKAWILMEFDQAESGNAFHPSVMPIIFAMAKHSTSFIASVRKTMSYLFDILRSFTNNSTITFDQFRAFHSCVQSDPNITLVAFDMIDVNKDGRISEDELCNAGVNFLTGEDEKGTGTYFLGKF